MATIKPFKAILAQKENCDKIASLPYDVMNRDEAYEMAKENSFSFLHVTRAEIDLNKNILSYDDSVYKKSKENFDSFLKNNILINDETNSLYIYAQTMDNRRQIGVVACIPIDDYINNKIKKHEKTLVKKEEDRLNHFKSVNAHTAPIFLTYEPRKEIKNFINSKISSLDPIFNFKSEDNIRHEVWKIEDIDDIKKLVDLFNEIDYLYIADGHHRAASAVRVGLEKRKEGLNTSSEFNYFMATIFPCDELLIMPYHRLVKDTNNLNIDTILSKLKNNFFVEKVAENTFPKSSLEFTMFFNDEWFLIKPKSISYNSIIEKLDVSILQNLILDPIFDIKDPRTSERIDFIGGIRPSSDLIDKAKKLNGVGFFMYPTQIKDLLKISKEDKIMPPKSTWFEPKLRSGLIIHPF